MNIVITGDSFVEGVGVSSGGWAQMLADRTKELAVSIFGIGGQTSQDLMKRIAGEIGSETAVVIISIGVNDSRIRPSLRRNEVPIDQFEDNVEKAICAVLEHGASCLVVGLTTVDEARTSPFKEDKIYQNKSIAAYDEVLRLKSHELNVGYVTVPSIADEQGALADGLHPSDVGHNRILSVVEPALHQLLSNESSKD